MATWINRHTLFDVQYMRRCWVFDDRWIRGTHFFRLSAGFTLTQLLLSGDPETDYLDFLLSRHVPDRYDLLQIEHALPLIKDDKSRQILAALVLKHKILRLSPHRP